MPWHNVEGAPGAFQWYGRTTVSDHLPVRSLCEGAEKHARGMVFICTLSAQIVKVLVPTSRFQSPEAGSLSKYVSVSVRVFRSEDLGKQVSLLF